jgi:hypothetical protein
MDSNTSEPKDLNTREIIDSLYADESRPEVGGPVGSQIDALMDAPDDAPMKNPLEELDDTPRGDAAETFEVEEEVETDTPESELEPEPKSEPEAAPASAPKTDAFPEPQADRPSSGAVGKFAEAAKAPVQVPLTTDVEKLHRLLLLTGAASAILAITVVILLVALFNLL